MPPAILTNAVRPGEHHTASRREAGVAGIFDHTGALVAEHQRRLGPRVSTRQDRVIERRDAGGRDADQHPVPCRLRLDRKSTRLNSSHQIISYAVFCLKKKNKKTLADVTRGAVSIALLSND